MAGGNEVKMKQKLRMIAAVLVFALAVTQLPPSDMVRVHAEENSTSLSGGEGIRSYTDADGNVFLGGKYIEVGISRAGSFGTTRSAPTKENSVTDDKTGRTIWFHPCGIDVESRDSLGMVSNGEEDGDESGWNALTSDYFLPELVKEGWMLGWDESCQASGCQAGTQTMQNTGIRSAKTVNKSTAYEACAETTIITTTNMQITQTVSFALEDKNFRTTVSIKNIGSTTRKDVRFLRGFDPDQGRLIASSVNHLAYTYNVIGNEELDENGISVTAYAKRLVDGKPTDENTTPFIYFTEDERAHAGWKSSTELDGTDLFAIDNPASPKDVYHLSNDKDGNGEYGDCAIFLYFDFPEIAAGEEVTTSYYSSMDTNILTAAEGLLRLDISDVDRDTEIPNRSTKKVNASVRAEITGVDPAECDVTYQWYQITPHTIPATPASVTSGQVIEGAGSDHFSFSPSGEEEDAGTYYIYCVVTAATLDGKQTVTKESKKLKIEVYNEYNVTYDANGGTGAIAGRTGIRQGSEIQAASANTLTPPEADQIFSCWNTEADGSGKNIPAGHMLSVNKDITLYAQWRTQSSIQFTVSLDGEKLTDEDDAFFFRVGKDDAEKPQDFKDTDFLTDRWQCDELEEDTEYRIYIYHVAQVGNRLIGVSDLFTTDETDPIDVKMYTIGWDINEDDRVDEETIVMAGEMPSHADPSKASNAQYTYIFDGWEPKLVKATAKKTYSAQFRQTENKYHVILPASGVANGYTVLPEAGSQTTVNYGGSYSFRLRTEMGWNPAAWVVTVNDIRLIPDAEGIYHIRNIGVDGRDAEVAITSSESKQLPVVAACVVTDVTKNQATVQFTCRHASDYYLILYRTEEKPSLTMEEAMEIIAEDNINDQIAGQPLAVDHGRVTDEETACLLEGLQENTGYTVYVIARNTAYDYSSLVRVGFRTLGTGVPGPVSTSSTIPGTTGSPSMVPTGSSIPGTTGSPSTVPTGSSIPNVSGSPSQTPIGSGLPNVSGSPSQAPTGSDAPGVSSLPSPTVPIVPSDAPANPTAPAGILPNQDNIDKVIAAITGIGSVSLTDDAKKRIEAARAAYDSLTLMEKALLPDVYYRMLIRAEQDYLLLKSTGDIWKNATVAQLEEVVLNQNTDEDIEGSIYNKIRARLVPKSDTVQQLRWHRVEEADGYIIYGNKCGLIYKMKRLKTVKKNDITSWTRRNQKPGTYYKYIVAAYRKVDGEKKIVSVSKSVHSITNGGKYRDPKGVKLNRSSRTTKVKGKVKITGHLVLAPKTRMKYHVKTLRFESSNPLIARVNKNGRVTGVKKGKTTIFVYAQNGLYKKFKITVTD